MHRVIDLNIKSLLLFISNNLSFREIPSRTWLHTIDARAKVLESMVFLIIISISQRIESIIVIYCILMYIAWSANIRLLEFVKKVWIILPIFTAIIAFPLLFSSVSPGTGVLSFPFPYIHQLTITDQGLIGFSRMILRVVSSVSVIQLLLYTTAWNDILASLTSFGVPSFFTLILTMTVRYIHLFVTLLIETLSARKSRIIGKISYIRSNVFLLSTLGILVERSLQLSEEVYAAMRSRGFTGNYKKTWTNRLSTVIYGLIALQLCICLVLWWYHW